MTMTKSDILKCCNEYGINEQELRMGAVTELLLGTKFTKDTGDGLSNVADMVSSVLTDAGATAALRWATWAKHAKATDLPGGDTVEALLNVRQKGIHNGVQTVQGSDAAAG